MAMFFTTCTYPNVLGLLSLTVCVMLATSAPALHVRQATDGSGCEQRGDIFDKSCKFQYFIIGSHVYYALLVHSVNSMNE